MSGTCAENDRISGRGLACTTRADRQMHVKPREKKPRASETPIRSTFNLPNLLPSSAGPAHLLRRKAWTCRLMTLNSLLAWSHDSPLNTSPILRERAFGSRNEKQTVRQSDPKSRQSDTQTVRPEKQTVRHSDSQTRKADNQTVRQSDPAGRQSEQTVRHSDSQTRQADSQTIRQSHPARRQSDTQTLRPGRQTV